MPVTPRISLTSASCRIEVDCQAGPPGAFLRPHSLEDSPLARLERPAPSPTPKAERSRTHPEGRVIARDTEQFLQARRSFANHVLQFSRALLEESLKEKTVLEGLTGKSGRVIVFKLILICELGDATARWASPFLSISIPNRAGGT